MKPQITQIRQIKTGTLKDSHETEDLLKVSYQSLLK